MTLWIVFAVLVGILLIQYGLPWLFRYIQFLGWKDHSDRIALTYDDGPDRETTTELLNLLEEHGVPATFYLVGFRAASCPEVVMRIASEGHLLGTHSYNHLHAWKTLPWKELSDSADGVRAFSDIIESTAPFRPPFGKITTLTYFWHRLHGRPVHWWTFDTKDTGDEHPNPDEFASKILKSGSPIILMHCHHAEPSRRKFVLELTRSIIQQAGIHGRELVRMDAI